MSDSRRKTKGVKFEDTRSASSRASTIGGSSTSSGHSGSQYTPEYNVGALEETLRTTVRELDDWKKRAHDANDLLRKSEDAAKAHVKALDHSYQTLLESKEDLEKQVRDLKKDAEAMKKENSRLQKKLEKYENQSEPSSPDSGKLRRSDSKKSKDPEGDRLKERFNRNSESPNETSSSKPPSSSRSKHSSGRRLSVSSSERTPYLEGWGPGGSSTAPVSHPASSSRRPPSSTAYITTNMPMPMPMPVVTSPTMQSPVYATPRSTAMPPMRPTVEYATYPHPHENYHQMHQLPRR
ncbi:hypothetical protein N0V82_004177 [Gnomoniopsis sp. IMI 355080]|nr:hypothetical protein N0V82_004177 [Gnomoniopsis sp. IMI 355080]